MTLKTIQAAARKQLEVALGTAATRVVKTATRSALKNDPKLDARDVRDKILPAVASTFAKSEAIALVKLQVSAAGGKIDVDAHRALAKLARRLDSGERLHPISADGRKELKAALRRLASETHIDTAEVRANIEPLLATKVVSPEQLAATVGDLCRDLGVTLTPGALRLLGSLETKGVAAMKSADAEAAAQLARDQEASRAVIHAVYARVDAWNLGASVSEPPRPIDPEKFRPLPAVELRALANTEPNWALSRDLKRPY